MAPRSSKKSEGKNLGQIESIIEKYDDFTNILEVEVPPELEKTVKTGLNFFDKALGGDGFTPSQVLMFTGTSGAGKTTAMLQMADSLTGKGNVVLFNGCEEAMFQVRKATRRLRIKNGFFISQHIKVNEIIDHGKKLIQKFPGRQLVLVIDSLLFIDDGRFEDGTTNSKTALNVIKALASFAKTKSNGIYPIVILINHVNKDGTFVGKNSIKHDIDTHLHLEIDEKKKSDTYGFRLLKAKKNRFGGCREDVVLDIRDTGLFEVQVMATVELGDDG